jgi:threonine synthase
MSCLQGLCSLVNGCFGKNKDFVQSKYHIMAKQVKSQKEMKVEDAFHNTSVSFNELFQKIRERDALITSQQETIAAAATGHAGNSIWKDV